MAQKVWAVIDQTGRTLQTFANRQMAEAFAKSVSRNGVVTATVHHVG